MSKDIFVFVVCGARAHIDTLHFSLPYLEKFSKREIIVLTDSQRNEIPIVYEDIIDVQTPGAFSHHEASIYLKTGIHRFLPKGNRYCYLDTDIITFSEDVDLIFNQYKTPISFGADHCTLPFFSPYAINCTCQKEFADFRNQFETALNESDPYRLSDDATVVARRKELQKTYLAIRQKPVKVMTTAFRYFLSSPVFKLTNDIHFDKKRRLWTDGGGNPFMKDFKMRNIAKANRLKWSWISREPRLKDGRSIWKDQCIHLEKAIGEKFNVRIKDKNWQHWNGGVFLFDDQSHPFLDTWHELTMTAFEDPYWKTRDQGTLITTVWKLGLQHHPVLDKKWNLIADYYNPFLVWTDKGKVQVSVNETIEPVLLHVYHHFEDTSWDFWNQLIKLASERKVSE